MFNLKSSRSACTWIRDGVLINRMHVNPVAFAFTFASTFSIESTNITELINFGFAQSGISAADKIKAFLKLRQQEPGAEDLQRAAVFYNDLASKLASGCNYFPGMPSLLQNTTEVGALNFITSAIEQEILNEWLRTPPGQLIAPTISEILGERPNFSKGRGHFAHVAKILQSHGGGKIYAVCDASNEIVAACALAGEFQIVPIGFGYAVKKENVIKAFEQANILTSSLYPLDLAALVIANQEEVAAQLFAAGAACVVVGDAEEIVGNLRQILLTQMAGI